MELSNQEKQALIGIKETAGYAVLMSMVETEVAKLRLPKFVSKDKSYNDIAIECLGKAYAVKKLEKIFKTIDSLKNESPIKKELFI
ncbi:MAG: hypothetical protein WCH76_06450 [Candidatus Riflemargulisbacteria bacterium]